MHKYLRLVPLLISSAVYGQDSLKVNTSGKQLEEINVFAQKKEEPIHLVPLSITAFSAKQTRDAKLWNIKDLTGMIPNFYAASPGDNRNVTSIRGIATTSYDPSVATYIDGVNQFGLDTYIAQLQDIERIEVLRGPQGTLYGRNAMGGVVNIITRQPDNSTAGFAELSFGNFGLQRYNLGLRTPMIKDKLFLGVSGLYSIQNGFFKNAFNGSNFDDQHSLTGNYYLKYIATRKFSMTFNVKHNDNRNDGAFPLAGSIDDALAMPFSLNQNNTGPMVDQLFNASLSLNYVGKGFNFSSQSAYQSNYRYYKQRIDADFSPIDGYSIVSDYGRDWNTVKVLSQEFRISSPSADSGPFEWIAGTYAFRQRSPAKQGTYYGDDGPLIGAPANFTQINTNVSTGTGLAAFAQGTYNIATAFRLTLGFRYDYEHKKQTARSDFQADGGELFPGQADTAARANFHAFSPKLGLQYLFNPQHNLFVTYSRGFRAGGISSLGADPTSAPLVAYKPEFSNNVEIGSKHLFADKRIRLNLSMFYTRVNNAQVPSLQLPEALTVTRNAGKLSSKGAEMEFSMNTAKNLVLDYKAGITDASYKTLMVLGDGAAIDLRGNRQIYTPKYTSMLAMQYAPELGKGLKLMVRGEFRAIGSQYFDLANKLGQKAYGVLNARLGVVSKHLEFYVWGANLNNKKYIDYAYDFGPAHLANPRTFGLTLRSSFSII